jgi:hypothetical protein
MDIPSLNTHNLTQAAMTALKNAYDECTDMAAKKSIITAFKAVIQLHCNLERNTGHTDNGENAGDYDPSEYCAAV